MKKIAMICVVCALMVGCDYTVPLVTTPDTPVDSEVVGRWERTDAAGSGQRLIILTMNEKEYLVVFPAGSENAMFARACLWRNPEATWAQLDWFGTAQGTLPEDNRTFQYATYTVESQTLTLRLLNPAVVAKDLASSEALVEAIVDHKDHPNLFRNEMVFQKVED